MHNTFLNNFWKFLKHLINYLIISLENWLYF